MTVTSFTLDMADVRELAFQLAHEPNVNSHDAPFRHPADVAWSASQFLASVVRQALPTAARLDRVQAERILAAASSVSLATLETRHWIRFVLGRLEIPTG